MAEAVQAAVDHVPKEYRSATDGFGQLRQICMEREVLWEGEHVTIPRILTENGGKFRRCDQEEKYTWIAYLEIALGKKEKMRKTLHMPHGVVHTVF